VIKLYAWEIPFQKQIADIREAELRILRKSRIVDIAATLTWYTAPFLVSYICHGKEFMTATMYISEPFIVPVSYQ